MIRASTLLAAAAVLAPHLALAQAPEDLSQLQDVAPSLAPGRPGDGPVYSLQDNGDFVQIINGRNCQIASNVTSFRVPSHPKDPSLVYYLAGDSLNAISAKSPPAGPCRQRKSTSVARQVQDFEVVGDPGSVIVLVVRTAAGLELGVGKKKTIQLPGMSDFRVNRCSGHPGSVGGDTVALAIASSGFVTRIPRSGEAPALDDSGSFQSLESYQKKQGYCRSNNPPPPAPAPAPEVKNARQGDIATQYGLLDGNLFRVIDGQRCQVSDRVTDLKIPHHAGDPAVAYYVRDGALYAVELGARSAEGCPRTAKHKVVDEVRNFWLAPGGSSSVTSLVRHGHDVLSVWDHNGDHRELTGVTSVAMNSCFQAAGKAFSSNIAFSIDAAGFVTKIGRHLTDIKRDDSKSYRDIAGFVSSNRVCQ
jgi:hypothetical protein